MTANISRRRLIESSIVGTAALAGATSAFASKPVAKWDETVDINHRRRFRFCRSGRSD